VFAGADAFREPLIVDVEEYIGVKSYKAKGKRITIYEVGTYEEIEPREMPEEELPSVDIDTETVDSDDVINQNDVRDELNGQMRLFSTDELN